MPTVLVPRSFFEKERETVYSNWYVSYWRELVSNAMDAGATAIKIRTFFADHRGETVFRVVIQDNGKGMDLDTIRDVYMQLGASTKENESQGVGGFGRARVLTTFSHPRYSIASGDVVVDGAGTSFEIRDSLKPIKGCAIIVDIEQRHAGRLQEGLFEFLEASNIAAKISLDLAQSWPDGSAIKSLVPVEAGKPVLWREKFQAGDVLSSFSDDTGPWATISVNSKPKALAHQLLVRVNGLTMHSEYLSEPIQVTVDLEPSRSREAMTASRDALHWNFRSSLMRFVQRLAADVVSAGRPRKEQIDLRITGRNGPLMLIRPGVVARKAAAAPAMVTGEANYAITARHAEATSPLPDQVYSSSVEAGPALLRHDFHLTSDDPTPEQRRVISKYNPEAWAKASSAGGSYYGQRLLAMWTEAMRLSVNRLFEQHSDLENEISLRCGFVFSERFGAKLQYLDDGSYAALLNPVDNGGHMRYRLSDAGDRKRIATLAMHESCHLLVDIHNEYYAKALTDLVGSFRDIDVDRVLKAAINDVSEEIRDIRTPDEVEPSL